MLPQIVGKHGSPQLKFCIANCHAATGLRQRANRPLVEAVVKVVESRGKTSLAARIAKAIAVLQLVEGFPVSRANVAAVLYPAVGATPACAAVP